MGDIRTFEASHIPGVASLTLKILRGIQAPPTPALEKYFLEIFFHNPWRGDDIQSLVYFHEGKIVGFLGVIPREMDFGGHRIRLAAATQLAVDRDLYRGFAGIELLRRFFSGPQEFSYTDGGTEAAHLSWTAAGARAASLYALEWTRTLRPCRQLKNMVAEKSGLWRTISTAATPLAAIADTAASKLPFRITRKPASEYTVTETNPSGLLEVIEEIGWRAPLKPAYEPKSFHWLIAQAASASAHGTLRLGIVSEPAGQRAGWFVYYVKRGGVSQVLQLGARMRHFDAVLLALFADAWRHGATAVRGQAIPRYLTNFTLQHCGLRHIGSGVLIHSRNEELMDSILRGEAVLTRLDGEWWTRFAVTDWS